MARFDEETDPNGFGARARVLGRARGVTKVSQSSADAVDAFDRWTRGLDVALALAGLIALAPLLCVLAILVRLEGRGPILARRPRLARDGVIFHSFHFRTTRRLNSPEVVREPAPSWTSEAATAPSPRLSDVGHYLVETGLDQLPELLNVLSGNMSLVGPRPIDVAEASTQGVARFKQTGLRPGMTGLWRIRRLSDPTDAERAQLDEVYARRRSLRLYLRVLVETLPAVLARRGWN